MSIQLAATKNKVLKRGNWDSPIEQAWRFSNPTNKENTMTISTKPFKPTAPVLELARLLLKWKSYRGLVNEQVERNRYTLRDAAGHCNACCQFDENGEEVWHNANCMGCRGCTSVDVEMNEVGSWLEERIYCDHCNQDGESAYAEGALVNATYYAKKVIQARAEDSLRVLKSRTLRDDLRDYLKEWADLERNRTIDAVGKLCGLAWAAGEKGSAIHALLEEFLVSWDDEDRYTFEDGFVWHFDAECDSGILDSLSQLPKSTQEFTEEALDEAEIQDFWIIRKAQVYPELEADTERVSVKVWIPVPQETKNEAPSSGYPAPSESREEWLRRFSNSLREVLDLDPLPEDHDFSPEATDRRLMALIRPADENESLKDGEES